MWRDVQNVSTDTVNMFTALGMICNVVMFDFHWLTDILILELAYISSENWHVSSVYSGYLCVFLKF